MMSREGANYRVTETLQASEHTLIYRGVRASDQHPVLLRVLGPRHALPKDVERLEHERQVGRLLDGSRTLRPLALDRVQGLPALVLEDFGGQPLSSLIDGPMELGRFLRLAPPICAALAEVHQLRIIHKDIQPANILVNEATGQVKITAFGIASILPREHQAARNPALIEGTLAYMSPEQTGRMNRTIDHRTDLYSLGVTFFEMLTGRLPFTASDPLEWVHCHVARSPSAPTELVPQIPDVLSQIVLRLLDKAAEHRYQSALGLKHDLELCQDAWTASGSIAAFPLGARDGVDRLSFPQTLYGREREAAALRAAFDRIVAARTRELVLISGEAGIGKSSLVHELHRPVVRERGLFLGGKFDQHRRNVPYATLVQAFRELILDLLTESDARVAFWRQRLLAALGSNGRLITDVIPELALIIGPQPPVPPLRPTDAQHRFALVMHRFIGVFPAPERPVVLFLDDLQWADQASLALLVELAAADELQSLLLVGAYRDNEVSPLDPLTAALDKARATGINVSTLALGPLAVTDVQTLVADTFGERDARTDELGALVAARTGGNPFFALQFLTAVYEEKLIRRDPRTHAWRFDTPAIAARSTTSNLVDFMIERVNQLSDHARPVVLLAAFLRGPVNQLLLSELGGWSAEKLDGGLLEAARLGVLIRSGDHYRFAHDRVQQAAYRLTPEAERPELHRRIGQALLARSSGDAGESAIFDIVAHLNLGAVSLGDPAERQRLAALNFVAGRKAKAANAHAAAVFHFGFGLDLLGPDPWQRDYELAYGLELGRAESRLLDGDVEGAIAGARIVAARAHTAREKVPAYILLGRDAANVKGDPAKAVATECEAFALLGITIPERPGPADVAQARVEVAAALAGRPIEAIVDLPRLQDPDLEAALSLTSSASFTDRNLYLVTAARMVTLSIQHGNADGSVFWYGCYGFNLAGLGECAEGQRFAKAAFAVRERHAFATSKGQAHFFLSLTSFWTEPLGEVLSQTEAAIEAWWGGGSPVGVALALANKVYALLLGGTPLDRVAHELSGALTSLRRLRSRDITDMCRILLQLVRALRGETRGLGSLCSGDRDGELGFDAEAFEKSLDGRWQRVACFYWLARMRLGFLAGEHEAARAAGERAQAVGWACAGNMPARDVALYHALVLAAGFDEASPAERERRLGALLAYEAQFRGWAATNPGTFAHNHALVAAEIARITGHVSEAGELYKTSIQRAAEGGFIHDEALAYELGATLREAQGLPAMADLYRREARSRYLRWGATAKVRQLDQRYPHLGAASAGALPASVINNPEQIDLVSVIRASQAISREVVLDRLLRKLMEIVLAQSGATRGVLAVPDAGGFSVQAEARVSRDGTDVETPVVVALAGGADAGAFADLPESMLRLTARTGETLVLDNAATEPRFAGDSYVGRQHPKSILCLPILRQTEVVAVLYLENDAVTGAFTPDRLAVLGILAGQAAISLDNGQLFHRLTLEIEERRRAEAGLRFLANAGTLLSESLDYEATLAKVGRLAVAALADWCLVDVIDEAGAIRRVASAHRDPEKEKLLRAVRERQAALGPPRYAAEVLQMGVPIFLAQEVSDDLLNTYVPEPEIALQAKQMGISSFFVLPLRVRGRTFGAMTFGLGDPERRFSPGDMALADEVAQRAAVAIENAGLYRAAQNAIKLRDDFLSIASHEFKAPIAALKMVVQGLEMELVNPSVESLHTSMKSLGRQATRLSRLVDELLDVSQLTAGHLHLVFELVDLVGVVNETTERLRDEAERARCRLAVRAPSALVGTWDRMRLEQVVTNLVLNATKFGRGKPIEIVVEDLGDRARIQVIDQGIGIAVEEHRRIFERFARAVSASHYGGLGLGLYIASQIVSALGGTIEVDSVPAQGAKFTVVLPKAPSNDGAARRSWKE